MPEIGEVARIVNYINKHFAGKKLATVKAQVDENVFGKVGCSAEAFERALTGKKVVHAKQQGKYFWMVMSSPPHPLMHFGMAGWFEIRNKETAYYKPQKPKPPEWPPKYWKFTLETAEEPKTEAAFVDVRRFGRIRLVDCAADDIRNVSPLVKNGPDPVVDRDILTEGWLAIKLATKKIPVKALLLDQANISGIGNWVGDEILYDARIHPEQYSNTLSLAQVKQLHKSIHYVCSFAVDNLADSSKFPKEWLFKHRWAKGKKDSTMTLPNGAKFIFVTVGGRTTCVVPSVQKKTGSVARNVEGEDSGDVKRGRSRKGNKTAKTDTGDEAEEEGTETGAKIKKRSMKTEDEEPALNGNHAMNDETTKSARKKRKDTSKAETHSEDA